MNWWERFYLSPEFVPIIIVIIFFLSVFAVLIFYLEKSRREKKKHNSNLEEILTKLQHQEAERSESMKNFAGLVSAAFAGNTEHEAGTGNIADLTKAMHDTMSVNQAFGQAVALQSVAIGIRQGQTTVQQRVMDPMANELKDILASTTAQQQSHAENLLNQTKAETPAPTADQLTQSSEKTEPDSSQVSPLVDAQLPVGVVVSDDLYTDEQIGEMTRKHYRNCFLEKFAERNPDMVDIDSDWKFSTLRGGIQAFLKTRYNSKKANDPMAEKLYQSIIALE